MTDITYEKYNHHLPNLALIVQKPLKLFVLRQTDFLKKKLKVHFLSIQKQFQLYN